jgi:hypothetical protein
VLDEVTFRCSKIPGTGAQPAGAPRAQSSPQRQRQRPFARRRHEPGPCRFPEGAADKTIQPPLAPTLQRARVNLQCFPDPTDSSWLQAMNHHRDQHDHQARIYTLRPRKRTDSGVRRRRQSASAQQSYIVAPIAGPQRLAIKIGTMQLPAAIKTALLTSLLGQIRIDFLQQLL